MGSLSIWHWLILLVIVMLLFGAGKVPRLMGDMAKGVKAFKEGLKDINEEAKSNGGGTSSSAQVPPPAEKKDPAKV